MAPEDSPLIALARQGVDAVNFVVAQRSTDNPRGEPSVDNQSNDRAKRVRSEAISLASGNRHLADNDACQWITQNRHLQECVRDREDLRNIIDDQRCVRARSSTPPRRSLVRDVTPPGRGGFCALAPPLRQVIWSEKFKAGHIDKYDGSNNTKKFIQVYHTINEVAEGDDQVKINYLSTVLFDTARSWLINLTEGSVKHPDLRIYTFYITCNLSN
jgi:hypothetical protein